MTCPSLETVAAWILCDLAEGETEAFEEHYFGCDACFGRAERLQKLAAQLETALPPILTAERFARLEAERPSLPAVHVEPGESAMIRLDGRNPVGVWVLHCSLEGVKRVDFSTRGEDGEPLFAFENVPFDAERGQVLMPCQLHYRALALDKQLLTELSARDGSGSRSLGLYRLHHEFR